MYAALQILKEKGGQAPGKDGVEALSGKLEFDDWAKHVYEKTVNLRWQSVLDFPQRRRDQGRIPREEQGGASMQEVRQLMGLLQKDGDVGMFVSTGGFTADAKSTARTSHVHVELVDFDRFVALWQDFYPSSRTRIKPSFPWFRFTSTRLRTDGSDTLTL